MWRGHEFYHWTNPHIYIFSKTLFTFITKSLGFDSLSQRQILSPLGLMLTTAPFTIRPESSKLSPIKQSRMSSLQVSIKEWVLFKTRISSGANRVLQYSSLGLKTFKKEDSKFTLFSIQYSISLSLSLSTLVHSYVHFFYIHLFNISLRTLLHSYSLCPTFPFQWNI